MSYIIVFLTTGRKRGRPRKRPRDENDQVIKEQKPLKKAHKVKPAVVSEKESSAAEGLLGLSDVGEWKILVIVL